MYVLIDSNNEVVGSYEDQDYANKIATLDGRTVISAEVSFAADLGYRYVPDLNQFEEYLAPLPSDSADD